MVPVHRQLAPNAAHHEEGSSLYSSPSAEAAAQPAGRKRRPARAASPGHEEQPAQASFSGGYFRRGHIRLKTNKKSSEVAFRHSATVELRDRRRGAGERAWRLQQAGQAGQAFG
ncbi:MAG: hypothetical protein ACPIOQ_48500, partial [Promethearchaeia archaeon]